MKDTKVGMFVELIDEEIEDGAVLEAIVEGGVSVRLQIATLFFVVSEFLHYRKKFLFIYSKKATIPCQLVKGQVLVHLKVTSALDTVMFS